MTAEARAVSNGTTEHLAETFSTNMTENFSADVTETFSAKVDDQTLYALVSAGLVGVHRSGSRQRKRGGVYDYRSHYRALRLNCPPRTVLAFGTPDRLAAKLASLGIIVCFAHSRPQLSVGRSCGQCQGRGVARAAAARSSAGAQ